VRGLNSRAGKADHHVMDLRGSSQRTSRPVLTRTVGVAAVDVYDVGVDRTTTPKIHGKTTQEDRWTGQNDHHVADLREDPRTRRPVLTRTVGVAAVDVDDVGVDQTTTRKIHGKTTQEDHWTGQNDHHVTDLRVAVVDVYDVGVDRTTTRKIHGKTTQEDHWTGQNDHHVTDLREDPRTRRPVLEHRRTEMDRRLMVMTKQDVVVDVVDLNVVERHDVEGVVSDGRSSDVRVVRASCDFTTRLHISALFTYILVLIRCEAGSQT